MIAWVVSLGLVVSAHDTDEFDDFDAEIESEYADDFRLIDQNDVSHAISYYRAFNYILISGHSNTCNTTVNFFKSHKRSFIRNKKNKNLALFLINPNREDRLSVRKNLGKNKAKKLTVLMDDAQIISKGLEISYAGDFALLDGKTLKPVLKGNLNLESCQKVIKENLFSGKNEFAQSECGPNFYEKVSKTIGLSYGEQCKMKFAKSKKWTYVKDIAPIVKDMCFNCHFDDAFGAFNNYKSVSGWGEMIRQTIRTDRMPPGGRDYYYGNFKSDFDNEDKRKLVEWVEAGMPRGDGDDILVGLKTTENLGRAQRHHEYFKDRKPDLVLKQEVPHTLPPTGVLEYQYAQIAGPMPRTYWARAVQLKANKRVVHHANLLILDKPLKLSDVVRTYDGMIKEKKSAAILSKSRDEKGLAKLIQEKQILTSRKLDDTPQLMPEGIGLKIPKGAYVAVEYHYQTSGRTEENAATIDLYLYDDEYIRENGVKELKRMAIYRDGFTIPPGEREFKVVSGVKIDRDISILKFKPHLHYRGRSVKYRIKTPRAKKPKTILSIPYYQFKAQRYHFPNKPYFVPEGSKLITEIIYDNSKDFFQNPDDTVSVSLGSQTYTDEMHLPRIYYVEGSTKKSKD